MTAAERLAALAKANAVRFDRARVKRQIHDTDTLQQSGRVLADFLEERHPALQSASVHDVLGMRRHGGDTATRVFYRRAGLLVSPTRRVQDLTARELMLIVTTLRLPIRNGRIAA